MDPFKLALGEATVLIPTTEPSSTPDENAGLSLTGCAVGRFTSAVIARTVRNRQKGNMTTNNRVGLLGALLAIRTGMRGGSVILNGVARWEFLQM